MERVYSYDEPTLQSIKNDLEASWLKAIVKNRTEKSLLRKAPAALVCVRLGLIFCSSLSSYIHAFFSVHVLLKAAVQASVLCLSLISHRYNKDTHSKTNAPARGDAFITVQSAVTDLILSYL